MTPQSVQREVARQIHHDRFVATRPWLVKEPAIRYAMVNISYKIHGDFGTYTLHTWSIGLTALAARRSWRNRNRLVKKEDIEYTTVTEPKQRHRDLALGERVVPEDRELAAS